MLKKIYPCFSFPAHHPFISLVLYPLSIILFLFTSCSTTPELPDDAPPPESHVKAFTSQARDPRSYWLTVYPGPNGPTFSDAFRHHPKHHYEARFPVKDGASMPIFRWNSKQGWFHVLLDTSSRRTWSTLDAALKLEVIPMAPSYIHEVTALRNPDVQGLLSILPSLHLDQLQIENAILAVCLTSHTLAPLVNPPDRRPPDVIFGWSFLRTLSVVSIDWLKGKIVFVTTTSYKPEGGALAAVPYRSSADVLTIPGFINGAEKRIVVDTAGDFAIQIPFYDHPDIRQLSIGDLVFRGLPVTSTDDPDASIAIGRRILSKFRLTIDNQKKIVYFDRPLK